MASKIWRNLIRTAAAACFVAGSSAQAGGVFYQSDFDPVEFIVKAIFNVDYTGSQCRNSDGFVWANALDGLNTDGRSCDVSLFSAVGTLNDSDANETAYLTFVQPPSIRTDLILGVYIEEGELAGILWDPTVLVGPVTTSGYTSINGTWKLSFVSTDFIGPPFDSTAVLWEYEQHSTCVYIPFVGKQCWSTNKWVPEYTAQLIYTRDPEGIGYRPLGDIVPEIAPDGEAILRGNDVPEPGSLALLGGALVAGWFTRRRKAAA